MKMPASRRTESPRGRRGGHARIVVLGAVLGTVLLFGPSYAQQTKTGGGSLGPAAGSIGGGATGGSNRGGASGISNPSPGGAPSSLGGPAQNSGPRATETSRPGYLGGRTQEAEAPTLPPSPPPAPGDTITIAEYNAVNFGDCPTPGTPANPRQRMSGSNEGRIQAVAQHLAHRARQDGATARYLVANIQEELERPQPDLPLIGTYFGLASRVPVTRALVENVSMSLCTPVTGSAAQSIADIAEAQRDKLRSDRRDARRTR
ncbi:MAG: hypothetical protein LJE90_16510 [Betaproteobacteria bacterium]|jgi:hypothetical protein|nr:hypothetical protein [Betaproteobacteria bacterium]